MTRVSKYRFGAIRSFLLISLFVIGLMASTTTSALAGGGGGFSLSVSPKSGSTQPGSAVVFIVTVKCNTCNVLVGASISPVVSNGPTLTLSSYHLINGGTPALRVDAGPSTPLMTYTITVIVKDTQSSQTKSASVTVTVNDFTITANPTSITVPAGQTATSTVTATAFNGFSGTIYYTTTGLACNLQPDPVTLSSTVTSVSSTLSCSGTPGTYNVVISGSPFSGLPVRSATVTITIQ